MLPTSFRAALRELLVLATPLIGMSISRLLINFVDFTMVSTLGTAAQAAISPCAMMLYALGCVGMGTVQSVQTFVSQAEGRNEPGRAGAFVWQGLYVAMFLTLLTAPIAGLVRWWFPWVGALGHHPPEVQEQEIRFLGYSLWSIGPATACMALESFYSGIRRPWIAMTGVLLSLVTIVAGNYALIFGHWGFPALGISGSGIATVAAWCVRLAYLAWMLSWPAIAQRYGTLRSAALQAEQLAQILKVGGPIALQWLVDIGAWLVFLELLMPPLGAAAMAAANIAIQLMHLSFMPALGVGMALTTQVGNEIGAGRPDDAVRRVRVARAVVCVYMGAMGLVFVGFGHWLSDHFCFEADPRMRAQVIHAAVQMLAWVAVFQLSDALCVVYSFASRGAGDTRVPALLFAACCWLIFVLGGYTVTRLMPQWSYHGLWATCSLYIIVLGVLLWRRFHAQKWRDMRIWNVEPHAA